MPVVLIEGVQAVKQPAQLFVCWIVAVQRHRMDEFRRLRLDLHPARREHSTSSIPGYEDHETGERYSEGACQDIERAFVGGCEHLQHRPAPLTVHGATRGRLPVVEQIQVGPVGAARGREPLVHRRNSARRYGALGADVDAMERAAEGAQLGEQRVTTVELAQSDAVVALEPDDDALAFEMLERFVYGGQSCSALHFSCMSAALEVPRTARTRIVDRPRTKGGIASGLAVIERRLTTVVFLLSRMQRRSH